MSNRLITIAALAGFALAALPLSIHAESTYDVDVKPELNGLPIKVEPQPFDGRLVMKLTNGGDVRVRCDLRYDASPQPIRRSYVYVKPGETVENSFRANRKWFSVAVGVSCKPADE